MPAEIKFNLRKCLDCHDEIYYKRYGKHRIIELERSIAEVRTEREFTYRDFQELTNEENISYAKYVNCPSREEVEPELEKITYLLRNRKERTVKNLVGELNNILKKSNMGFVSTLLRFAFPEDFALLSSRTLTITEEHGAGNSVMTYLGYLRHLKKDKKEFEMDRSADVDMAWWSLSVCQENGHRDCENYYAFLKYQKNPLKRAKHLFAKKEYNDAAAIVSKIFATEVTRRAKNMNIYCKTNPEKIKEICKQIEKSDKVEKLLELWKLRNIAHHPDPEELNYEFTDKEVQSMISIVEDFINW